jgi:membrane associated rhomboid family serine protease
MIPLRTKHPPESLPVGTCLLVLINAGVFATTIENLQIRKDVLDEWGLRPSTFDFPHVMSSMFLHANLIHLIGNMLFLYVFGFAVEGRLKTPRFLLLYLLAGFAGDCLQILIQGGSSDIPSIGASGAIMGVVGAAIYLFPFAQVTMLWTGFYYGFGRTFDWPVWGVGLYYLGFDILLAALAGGKDGVGHFAHIGGAVAGVILAFALRGRRDSAAASEARAVLSDTKDLSVLSAFELKTLSQASPDDTHVTLNWAHRCLRDPRGMTPECMAAFQKHLPKMIREQPIGPVASVVAALGMTPGAFSPHVLMDIAWRVEQIPDPSLALRLYQQILDDPRASESDKEATLFRMGMLYEVGFQRPADAAQLYQRILDHHSMGGFAEQARMRLRGLGVKA